MTATIKAEIVYIKEPEPILMGCLSLTITLINHGSPRHKRISSVLAPSEFDTPIPPKPRKKIFNYIHVSIQ